MPQGEITAVGAVAILGSSPAGTGDPAKPTLAELRARLNVMLGSPVDLTAAQLTDWLNDAATELQSMLKLAETRGSLTFTTVDGEDTYLLPAYVGPISSVNVSGETPTFKPRPLFAYDLRAWRLKGPWEGHVEGYYRQGRLLLLWPQPDRAETIVVDYREVPGRLAADDEQYLLDAKWKVPLLQVAKWIAMNELGQPDVAGAAYNSALASIRSKRSAEAEDRLNGVAAASFPRSWKELGVVDPELIRED